MRRSFVVLIVRKGSSGSTTGYMIEIEADENVRMVIESGGGMENRDVHISTHTQGVNLIFQRIRRVRVAWPHGDNSFGE